MRTNGFIYTATSTALATVDGDGEPIFADTVSEKDIAIPCLIKTVIHHNKGTYEDGSFTVAKYEILIEICEFDVKRVKLERQGLSLGEFAIQDIQELSGVGRIKIVV